MQEITEHLDTKEPTLSFDPHNTSTKVYIKELIISRIKVRISFKMGKKALEVSLNPTKGFGGLQMIFNLFGSLADISDTPLKYNEIRIIEGFYTIKGLTTELYNKYFQKSVLQFYKILGSIDLIGNPVSLVDKVTTGAWRLYDDPRKGSLKGGCGCCKGCLTGLGSCLGYSISGCFDSLSSITKALYSIVRNVGGYDAGEERLTRPQNICSGIFVHGVGGCIAEVGEGAYSCVTKPCKADKSSVQTCLSGTAKGMFNVIVSPFSGTLRWIYSTSYGASECFKTKDPKIVRGRFPRQFGAEKILRPYENDMAMAEYAFSDSKHEREEMAFYRKIHEVPSVIFVMTTFGRLLLYRKGKSSKRKTSLNLVDVVRFEIYEAVNTWSLNVCTSKNKKLVITHFNKEVILAVMKAIDLYNP